MQRDQELSRSTLGRRKIKIERIKEDRVRQVTFIKRKSGLMKKAIELSVLCDCDIAVLVFNSQGRLFDYSSTPMDSILARYDNFQGPHEQWSNENYAHFEAKRVQREAAKEERERLKNSMKEKRDVSEDDSGADSDPLERRGSSSRRSGAKTTRRVGRKPPARYSRKANSSQANSKTVQTRTRSGTTSANSTAVSTFQIPMKTDSGVDDGKRKASGRDPALSVSIPEDDKNIGESPPPLSPKSRHQLNIVGSQISSLLPSPYNRLSFNEFGSPEGIGSPPAIPLAMSGWPLSNVPSRAGSAPGSPPGQDRPFRESKRIRTDNN